MDDNIENTVSYLIPTSNLVKSDNIEDLTCLICLGICYKPVVLTCCEHLTCLSCMKKYVEKSSNCPYCKSDSVNFSLPSKLVTRFYENLTFYCPFKDNGCKEVLRYNSYFEHYNTCTFIEIESKYTRLEYCKTCFRFRLKGKTHACDSLLVEPSLESNGLYLKLVDLERKSILLTKEPEQLIIDGIKVPDLYDNKNIHKHPLKFTSSRLHPGYEPGWTCEFCNDNIRKGSDRSFHCEECLFDVCFDCFKFIRTRNIVPTMHNHTLTPKSRGFEWICDSCERNYYRRSSWQCVTGECEYDVCIYCYWA